ncbi:hypothetical protein IE53DRAFT_88949 [Violaceomyces palustris]|uniref:Uncharacterized protein n=1 Tax=Violaceomyces palustris TaxID=1673888 RepID=A0ACD0NXP7_9BASI|nr:hypothetical protein IE53DRAFT_88949 [Violaceomyces palustris]
MYHTLKEHPARSSTRRTIRCTLMVFLICPFLFSTLDSAGLASRRPSDPTSFLGSNPAPPNLGSPLHLSLPNRKHPSVT